MKSTILHIFTVSATLFSLSLNVAAAEFKSVQPAYVVELFTSQGCSSCPPANSFVSKLAQNEEEALVLSYGVTYWDYLGWKDTFGDPRFTERQREYGKAFGATIYTPQIVLNGSAHSPRYSKSDVVSMPLPERDVEASLKLEGKTLMIDSTLPGSYNLSLVRFMPGLQEVNVKRGENGGRTLKIENVVTDIHHLDWVGSPISIEANLPKGETYAVLFHAADTAKIVTAAVLK